MTIPQRLAALRALMQKNGYDAYLIPTADFHQSEYVGGHFAARAYFSGFTGSAGTLLVLPEKALLWTDGRYFLQAEQQLADTGVTLCRMGESGVPTILEYLEQKMKSGEVLGFDGRVVSAAFGKELSETLGENGVRLEISRDLAGEIWIERPALSAEPAWLLSGEHVGETAQQKLSRVRAEMEKQHADIHILAALDDIAWLLNLRGGDVAHNPVVLAFAAVTMESVTLFVNPAVIGEAVCDSLAQAGVTIAPYDSIYEYLSAIPSSKTVLWDEGSLNYAMLCRLPENVRTVNTSNPSTLMKCRKNPVEQENLIRCHLRDGVAMVKFIRWLKQAVGREPVTERSACDYLAACRAEQEGFLDLSFGTIAGYQEHGAIVHYAVTEESDVPLAAEGMLLVDSGGQYLDGTTDITRTIVLGSVPEEWKVHFTAVLRGMLHLQQAKFLHGTRGVNLDVLARIPAWELGLDFKHGTGHGVGYLLNVHEGPQRIYWKIPEGKINNAVFEEGMVTSDEPGLYIAGSHGIRLENELLCRAGEQNEYGQFLYFEPLTYAPIDLDGVLPGLMSDQEIGWLNDYHERVYRALAPLLTEEEADWLRENTRPVQK
jgi:Xaa-Pro aminopeptidase